MVWKIFKSALKTNKTYNMKTTILALAIFSLASCDKNSPYEGSSIDSTCNWGNGTVKVDFTTVGVQKTDLVQMASIIPPNDTVDIRRVMPKNGHHTVFLNQRESGCIDYAALVLLVNGKIVTGRKTNCRSCQHSFQGKPIFLDNYGPQVIIKDGKIYINN